MTTIQQIEKELQGIETEQTKAIAANNKAIELEEGKQTWNKKQQAANVEALKNKRDAIAKAYDSILEKKRGELNAALTANALLEVKQGAEIQQRAEKVKQDIYRAFISAGGIPKDFEAHYQAVITARTIAAMNTKAAPIPAL